MPLRFGECVLDAEARLLTRGGARQDLSPKAFQFLELLLRARPRALSKEELYDSLWPKTFVSRSSLPRLMAEVRAALGDDAREPRFLRTVQRFGYAFSGEASESAPAGRADLGCRIVWGERQIDLAAGANLLGRSADSRVVLDMGRVSRHHARIYVADGQAVLEDLGSKNGTFVRGKPVREPVPLVDGDEICIGPVVLVFRTALGNSTTETGT